MTTCFVRCEKLTLGAVTAAGVHARGTDAASRRRRRADAGMRAYGWQLGWEKPRAWKPEDAGVDYAAAYAELLERTGARQWGTAAAALHLIVGVSPDWIKAGGDPYDVQDNARVYRLLREAHAWADREVGGVFATRYDVDERGCAIVDVLCAPTRVDKRQRVWISTKKSLEALRVREGAGRSYSALQDSWARAARERLDATIVRGEPWSKSGRPHLPPEAYGAEMDAERRRLADQAERLATEALRLDYEGERQDLERLRLDYEGERADRARAEVAYEREEVAYERAELETARRDAIRQAEGWLAAAAGKRRPD